MPLKGDARREYQRLWARNKRARLRAARGVRGENGVKRGVGGKGGRTRVEPVEPTKSKQPPNKRSLATVVYTLRRQVEMQGRELQALEKSYVQHQAEHIVHETPRVYADYLEEEGEEP